MERDANQMSQSPLCRSGCGFYGSPAQDGLCSKCYKDALKRKQQSGNPSSTNVPNAASMAVSNSASAVRTATPTNLDTLAATSSGMALLASAASSSSCNSSPADIQMTSPTPLSVAQSLLNAAAANGSQAALAGAQSLINAAGSTSNIPAVIATGSMSGSYFSAQPQQQQHQVIASNSIESTVSFDISNKTESSNYCDAASSIAVSGTQLEHSVQFCAAPSELAGPSVSVEPCESNPCLNDKSSGELTNASESDDRKEKPRNRCHVCHKKVGLTGFECRCGGMFCSLHRYSDKHDCQFDYRQLGAQEIRKNNPVVVGEKIKKI